jgi:hypothetical protein
MFFSPEQMVFDIFIFLQPIQTHFFLLPADSPPDLLTKATNNSPTVKDLDFRGGMDAGIESTRLAKSLLFRLKCSAQKIDSNF